MRNNCCKALFLTSNPSNHTCGSSPAAHFRRFPKNIYMKRDGKIIVIEDDQDDREFIKEIYDGLGYSNELVLLEDSTTALEYLRRDDVYPFLILSDINMPKMNGFELRDEMLKDATLTQKCVPYVFFTTAQSPESIITAYKKSVQGFFYKMNDYTEFGSALKLIIDYWKLAVTPHD